MRRPRVPALVSVLALLIVVGPACDTDQPLNGGAKNFTLSMVAVSSTRVYDVWNYTEDQNGDGRLDPNEDVDGDARLDVAEDTNANGRLDPGEDLDFDGNLDVNEDTNGNGQLDLGEDVAPVNGVLDTGVWCENTGLISDANVPWNYSLRIDVIRAGATEPTTIYTSGGLSDSFPNQGPYDTLVQASFGTKTVTLLPRRPNDPTVYGDPIPLRVTNGERISQGNRRLLDARFARSPSPDNAPVCLVNAQLGNPEIAGGPLPYGLQLNPGDTLQVQARKQSKGSSPVIFNPDPQSPDTPRLQAIPTLEGLTVAGTGTTISGAEDKAGLSFYVTLR